jgi:hypothetical protein
LELLAYQHSYLAAYLVVVVVALVALAYLVVASFVVDLAYLASFVPLVIAFVAYGACYHLGCGVVVDLCCYSFFDVTFVLLTYFSHFG